jgi:uncharacterized protein (DUF983 family)|tara:strand:+ start:1031 stop:1189 length:159 start_codon:yes stop_codon:yes gene_type:complete
MEESTECSICSAELHIDEGDIQGNFGILPVGFCVTCFACVLDMAQYYLGEEE